MNTRAHIDPEPQGPARVQLHERERPPSGTGDGSGERDEHDATASGDPIAILVVDDDRRNLLAVEAMLSDLDLSVVCVASVDDALRQLLRHDFALILLDIQMPEMNGVQLASIIRSRERTRSVPIIFLTAYDRGEDYVLRAYNVGAVDFLFKPPPPAVLRSKVLGFVELHRKTREVERQAERLRAAERDAHERRLAEFRASMEAAALRSEMAASKRMNERLQLLASVATELLSRTDPADVVETLAARFIQHLGYEVCVGFQLQAHDPTRMRLIGAAGAQGTGWHHASIQRDQSVFLGALLDDCTRYVAHELEACELPPALAELGLSSVAAFPLLSGGRAVGFLACGRRTRGPIASEDIAAMQVICDQIALAMERARLMRALQEHADALSDEHRRKDEFLAMLAHELRNPLAPMSYALDMMRVGEQDARTVELRAVLRRQLSHLNRMVDDLLDVSRITSGKIELELGRISINDILRQALETSRPLIERQHHTVEVELVDPDVVLHADSTRLTQVVANLLNNAARYTDPGGRIHLIAERSDERLLVRVRDNGRGIAADMLPRVFDLFVQAARTRDRSQGGLGLGLTLVRRLVEMHGGTVEATSAGTDHGSEFIVSLPIAGDADTPGERDAPSTERLPTAVPGGGLSILVVEDNEDSREMLQMLLEARGHRVDTAADGLSGLQELLTERHDVALLDIGLPGVDGYEIARRLRSERPSRATRLVAITGYGQGEDRARALAAGFDEHLVKPVTISELERVLPRG